MAVEQITLEQAVAECRRLRQRLEEAEEAIRAIRQGEVDAFVVSGPSGEQIYTLTGVERTYRLLVEAMNEGALVLSPDGTIVFSNRTFAAMLGRSVYDVLGKPVYDFVSRGDVARLKALLRRAPSAAGNAEVELRKPGGRTAPASVSIESLADRDDPSLGAVVTDLTETKEAQRQIRLYREHLEELVIERTTELNRLVEQLGASERQVVSLLESISDGFASFDESWRVVYVNREAELLLGEMIGTSREALIGQVLWEAIPQLHHTSIQEMFLKTMSEQTPQKFVVGDDSRGRWLDVCTYPSTGGMSVYVQDVTARKCAEDALRASEERYRAVLSNMDEAFCIIEVQFYEDEEPVDYRFIEANPAFERHTGLRNVIGKTVRTVMGSIEDVWITAYGKVAKTGIPIRFESWSEDLGKWFEVYAFRFPELGKNRVAVLFTDSTEKKTAEQNLAEARAEAERRAAQLESFVTSLADGLVLVDASLNVLMMNEPMRKLLGLPDDCVLEHWVPPYQLETIEGRPVNRSLSPSRRAIRGHQTTDERFRIRTRWKESLVSVSASPVRDASGAIIGASMSFRDASERIDFERAREEVVERERHISHVLQQALIPVDVPSEIGAFRVAVKYLPALNEAEIGGDFYDVFEIGDGKVGVLIGDVAGKGLDAAIRIAAVRYSVRSYAYLHTNPSYVITLANRALCKDMRDECSLVTAFFLILDTKQGVVSYSSAGHEPPVVCRSCGTIEELGIGGKPLSFDPAMKYTEGSVTLQPGDTIVMVTDGITEARAPGLVLFEKKGLTEYVASSAGAGPEDIAAGVMGAAVQHASGRLQDDAAVVVVRLESDRKPVGRPPLEIVES